MRHSDMARISHGGSATAIARKGGGSKGKGAARKAARATETKEEPEAAGEDLKEGARATRAVELMETDASCADVVIDEAFLTDCEQRCSLSFPGAEERCNGFRDACDGDGGVGRGL